MKRVIPFSLAAAFLYVSLLVLKVAAAPDQTLPPPRWTVYRYIAERKAIGLRWKKVPGAVSYSIFRKAGGEQESKRIASVPGLHLQYVDLQIVYGREHTYFLRCLGPSGMGPPSKAVTVLAIEREKILPPSPLWLDVQVDPSTADEGESCAIRLLWSPVPDTIAYNIYRRTGKEGDFVNLNTVKAPQFMDSAVVGGERYAYRLTAVSRHMVEGDSSEVREVLVKPARKKVERAQLINEVRIIPTRLVKLITGDDRVPIKAPVDIVMGQDNLIYVLDNQVPGVLVFSPEGQFLRIFGHEKVDGKGILRSPYGIAADPAGFIWVTDRKKSSEIIKFDPNGKVVFSFVFRQPPKEEALELIDPKYRTNKPFALDLDFTSNGEMVLTDNTFHRVCRFDEKGRFLGEFGLAGSQQGHFYHPSKIAVDDRDRLFVLDSQNRRVQVFSNQGRFLFEIGRSKTMVGSFLGLSGIAFVGRKSVIIADSPMATIQAFDLQDGSYQYHFGDEDRREDSTGARALWDVVTPSGLIYEAASGRIWLGMPMIHAVAIREVLE